MRHVSLVAMALIATNVYALECTDTLKADKAKTLDLCEVASDLADQDVNPNRAEVDRQVRENLLNLKNNPTSLDWGKRHGLTKGTRDNILKQYFNADGSLNEPKVQALVDHLSNQVKNCDTGVKKASGVKTTTYVDTTASREYQEPLITFTGPFRKTQADKFISELRFSDVEGEFLTGCRVYNTPDCKDSPPAAVPPLSENDKKIDALLKEPPPMMVGLFKANSRDFKSEDAVKAELKSQLTPFTQGKAKKLKKIQINTCSSMDRNCKDGAASGPACELIEALRRKSDAEILNPVNRMLLGLNDQQYQEVKEILTNPALGYKGNVDAIYDGSKGYSAAQNDAVGRELRTWLFLSAYRGKAIRDSIQKDYPGVEIEVNPAGVDDDGYGFSNASILPGTCGGMFGTDQFFGKLGTPGGENSCSMNTMAVKKITSMIKSKYAGIEKDYQGKLQDYGSKYKLPDSNESKYSMSRYAQAVPVVALADPGPIGGPSGKPGAKKQDDGVCKVWCFSFSAGCGSVGKETFTKRIGRTITETTGDLLHSDTTDKRNRGSTKCPKVF